MSKQLINVGTIINDGTGDTFRAGAIKVNSNFDELYTALTKDTALSVVNYITAGPGITVDNNSGTITIANTLAGTHSFGVVKIGATNVASAIQQDTLNLTAGSGINISGNSSTKTITVSLSGNITSTLNGLTYPATSGTSGQVLTSNGTNAVAWTTQIPTQTNNSGRLLTTNGTATSWTTDLSVNGSRVTTTANSTLNLTGKAGYIANLVGSSDVQMQWIASASLPTVTGVETASTNYVYVNSTGTTIENVDAQSQSYRWRFQTNGILSVPGPILGTSLQSNSELLIASVDSLGIRTGDIVDDVSANILIKPGTGISGGDVFISGGTSTGTDTPGGSVQIRAGINDTGNPDTLGYVSINAQTFIVDTNIATFTGQVKYRLVSLGQQFSGDETLTGVAGSIFSIAPLTTITSITVPDGDETLGTRCVFTNRSTSAIPLKSSTGSTIATLPAYPGAVELVHDGFGWYKL